MVSQSVRVTSLARQRSIIVPALDQARHLAQHEHKSDQKNRVDSEIPAKLRERIHRMTEFL
jgi:hypothetical protein